MNREYWVVRWHDKQTGEIGRSIGVNKKIAECTAAQMNEDYPDVEHWAAPVKKPKLPIEPEQVES